MRPTATLFAIGILAATPAFSQGDAASGESLFRQCQACHVVVSPDGETLAGRNAKTGPNLYAIADRPAGSIADFRYSKSMTEAGEAGLIWDETNFVGYVQDPSAFLKEYLDDSRARGAMAFKVRSPEDAADLYAFLVSLAPEPDS